tara:strand:- start:6947 stop:7609 length:663 start_codon:yes stop_codon:yes gene_type:complete
MSTENATTRLKNTARVRLPGAGIDALELELFNTIVELCTETGVWRERIERNIVANKINYDVGSVTGGSRIGYIMSLTMNGTIYQQLGADAADIGGNTGYELLEDFTTVRINPAPSSNAPKALKASITLIPTSQTTLLPDAIMALYTETILDGLMGRMMSHVAKPYSNPDQSRYHQRRFRAAITRIRRTVRAGNTKGSPPWIFPQQAPGRSQRNVRIRGGV